MSILHATNKVGLLPYRVSDAGPEFLLHLPRPKKADEAHQMKWGLMRGTVRWQVATGEWIDIRERAMLDSIALDAIEPHKDAALHEAEEELGLLPTQMLMDSWRDHELQNYASETKGSYDLHLFSVQVRDDLALDQCKSRAHDSLDIGWFSFAEMQAMIAQEKMKAGYLPMVEVVLDTLTA